MKYKKLLKKKKFTFFISYKKFLKIFYKPISLLRHLIIKFSLKLIFVYNPLINPWDIDFPNKTKKKKKKKEIRWDMIESKTKPAALKTK